MKKKVLMSEEALRLMLGSSENPVIEPDAADIPAVPDKQVEPDAADIPEETQIGVTELAALATEFEEYKVSAAAELEATKAELAELATAHAAELVKIQTGADGL